ncbi:hypothetical protein C1645_765028 [Glomus cerebriforme]|uniref:Uncharacterized protein n=1 Tax=Glomus cerebriforme TaxID=658196 RepID=A0A397T3M6_9GLOM|nr:hypothetical protein C1645_765028 [Glomus cerebriforme]
MINFSGSQWIQVRNSECTVRQLFFFKKKGYQKRIIKPKNFFSLKFHDDYADDILFFFLRTYCFEKFFFFSKAKTRYFTFMEKVKFKLSKLLD